MDVVHCVITVPNEVAKFNRAADKTPLQRLSYMSCRPPLTLSGFGCLTLQIYTKKLDYTQTNLKKSTNQR